LNGESPLVSIFTGSRNGERYVRATLDSILAQDYENIEVVIADGVSTDRTLEIIAEYAAKDPRIKCASEPDADATEGFYKALKRTSGKYVMFLPVSDVYLDRNWITKCVGILESDKATSMVHGCPVYIDEKWTMTGVPFVEWLEKPPPSGEDYTAYYLATNGYLSEITYCVRRDVYVKCYPEQSINHPKQDTPTLSSSTPDPFLWTLYEFFKSGYMARYVPVFASGGMIHGDSRNTKFAKYNRAVVERYKRDVGRVRASFLFFGLDRFDFLDSDSRVHKSLSGAGLMRFRLRILYYRLAVKPMFGYGRNAPLFVASALFRVFVDRPRLFALRLWGRLHGAAVARPA
jgi:glycosyltransferase involved in cell wall biosynthesis